MAKRIEAVETAEDFKFSATSLGMFYRCGKQYAFRYLDGVKIPPNINMVEGRAHHAALAENNRAKARRGYDLLQDRVVEVFMESLKKEKGEAEPKPGKSELNAIAVNGEKVLATYLEEIAPDVFPEEGGVEKEFSTEVKVGKERFTMRGYIDLVRKLNKPGRRAVADYKVGTKRWGEGDVEQSLQLGIYANQEDTPDAEIIALNPKDGIIKEVTATLPAGIRRWAVTLAAEAIKAIRTGLFLPANPESWACTEKWCGYWRFCRGKKK